VGLFATCPVGQFATVALHNSCLAPFSNDCAT
jgi:hypothetical protein